MNRRELETLLLTLESTPVLVARAAAKISPEQAREGPAVGGFSLIEHVWHLADLEREGYGTRIRRILSEDEPILSDFEGARVASERVYRRRDLAEGLAAFAAARACNINKLRSVSGSDWKRKAVQESAGLVTLEDIPRMMSEHDQSHTREIAELLAHVRFGMPVSEHQSSAVA